SADREKLRMASAARPGRSISQLNPFFNQCSTHCKLKGVIDRQYGDCRAPDRTQANQLVTLPSEVVAPLILARMEQARKLASRRINTSDVWALAEIAESARNREILDDTLPAVLPGNNMVDHKPKFRKRFRQMTILATIGSEPSNFQFNFWSHAMSCRG